jgi:hypothetical protein
VSIKWKFPLNGGGLSAGANDGAIDTFKGHRLSSMVREVAQNSLDAVDDLNQPVTLEFSLFQLPVEECPEVVDLKSALKQCEEVATEQHLEKDINFYKHAANLISTKKKIPFLAIHDSNTTGLTGPVEGPTGAWHALVKGSGLTQKSNSDSLGSFGHGSKAPFTLTALRSLFYFSLVKTDDGLQRRFQGKSILQSHRETKTQQMTQGTGFYGHEEACKLLLDAEVPDWVLETRSHLKDRTGTSLLLPFYSLGVNEEPETAISLVANFYYAIRTGKLVVKVGDREISQKNLDSQCQELEELLEAGEQDHIDVEHTQNCFKAISAIIDCEESSVQQIKDLGQIHWYLRFGDDLDRGTVSIARQNGMLITRKAPYLKGFRHKKPFEFFACITGPGSELLKRLESPAHDQLQFDRIDDPEVKRKLKREYKKISNKIREVIDSYASLDQHDDQIVDDLRDLFAEITEASSGDSRERSTRLQISTGSTKITKPSQEGSPSPGVGARQEVPGRGEPSGDGKKGEPGGSIPDPSGRGRTERPRADDGRGRGEFRPLENLRVRFGDSPSKKLTLFFDSPGAGGFDLKLFKKGEFGEEIIRLLEPKNNDSFDSIGLSLDLESGRASVELSAGEFCRDFALTAKVSKHE